MLGVLCKIPTAHDAYASTDKTKIVLIRDRTLFVPGADAPRVNCMLGSYVAYTVLLIPKPFGGR